ncbi:hypothetical protein BCR39DRAFT_548981 [Naematelia encephala]|uniref:Chromatin modification-related protein n=1 Tax=Naematelia encephala TaxID=71784 RepID=A0A1Y2AM37_9TREE|nr:hypothetical protein BCR39DRAFT_548981 [Naematelia encephala]
MPPKASVAHQPSASPPPPPGSSEAQDLLVIQDFMDTLDQIPPELTRVHSDLNELGAVLYSTLQNLEVKLNTLINWIQDPSIGVERRFQLLQEIAEEAARYKLGGDDKIRVAGGACDGIMAHQRHISNLLTASTLLQPGPPSPYTQSLTLANLPPTSNTRRGAMRANNSPFTGRGYASTGAGGALGLEGREHPTPTKKKKSRVQQLGAGRDDDEVSSVGGDRKKPPVKKKRATNRAPSPTESTGSGYGQASKPNLPMTDRQRAAAEAKLKAKERKADDDSEEEEEGRRSGQAARVSPSAESNVREGNGDGRESRVSRVRAGVKRGRADDEDEDDEEDDGEEDVKPQAKRTTSNKKTTIQADELPIEDTAVGDGERLYCTCQAVSYGEMIGCDNEDCDIEWFHLACLGLDKTPEGTWYCPYCVDKFSKVPKKKAPPKAKARK